MSNPRKLSDDTKHPTDKPEETASKKAVSSPSQVPPGVKSASKPIERKSLFSPKKSADKTDPRKSVGKPDPRKSVEKTDPRKSVEKTDPRKSVEKSFVKKGVQTQTTKTAPNLSKVPSAVVSNVDSSKAAVVKDEESKSAETTSVKKSVPNQTLSSNSEVPPAVGSNIYDSKAVAIQEVSVTLVPNIIIAPCKSPAKIKEELQQNTGASRISEAKQEIEIEQNVEEKLPLKPGCEEPEKTRVLGQLKSGDTPMEEVRLSSETKDQKKSEVPKLDINIDLSKTEFVTTAPIVPVSKIVDSSTGQTKDESEEKVKSPDSSEKFGQRFAVVNKTQRSEKPEVEIKPQISEESRSETCLKTDPAEFKSFVEMPQSLSISISDTEKVSKIKAGEYTQVPAHEPAYPKALDDSTETSIDLEGLPSNEERTQFFGIFSDNLLEKMETFKHSLRGGGGNKTHLKVPKPGFPYTPTRLEQIVSVNKGKFKVSLDISRFDFKNIKLSIEDGKIHVCARQENETEFGMEYHEIQQIFRIPKHVKRDAFSACITDDYNLLVEAPILIPSSKTCDSSK